MSLLSFHNDPAIKKKYLDRVTAHELADEIVKGQYWEDGKGCAVGCSIHSDDHKQYEIVLGIPKWLAVVEDYIFEGLPNARAKTWPREFLEAIPVGIDLEPIKAPFLIFILESTLTTFDHDQYPDAVKAVNQSIALWRRDDVGSKEWDEAAEAAGAAGAAADAAWATRAAAEAAAEAAGAAGAAADAAWATRAAEAAEAAAYESFADKLLELLKGEKKQ